MTDPQTLLEEAKCYACYGAPGLWELMELALLAQIVANGGGGGGGDRQVYTGSFDNPNGNVTPDNTAIANWYYKDEGGTLVFWQWSVTNQNWSQVSG